MYIMSALSLSQQQKIQTKLSPEQIQVIKMLELPAVELHTRINEELQTNPVLEEGKDPELTNHENEGYEDEQDGVDFADDDINETDPYDDPYGTDTHNENQNKDDYTDDYAGDGDDDVYDPIYNGSKSHSAYSDDDSDRTGPLIVNSISLMEHLKAQVYLTNMTKAERHIAKWVLGNIDDDGFLRRTTEQLVDDLCFQEGLTVSDQEMENIVAQIKKFDPAGVAAYTLQECWLNQLKQKKQTPIIKTAIEILESCFEDLARHHYNRIAQKLNINEDDLRQALNEIFHLNAKPANAFNGDIYEGHKETIIPDFYVENRDGKLIMSLNTGDIPELHVSAHYRQTFNDCQKKNTTQAREDAKQIKAYIDQANWFINAIAQRNETLQRTMAAIIAFQHDFFIEGDETFLKPMILQDIADRTGYDVSTISRVSNSKYVQTEFGIYPLKHFFSESLVNTQGDEISTREVKKILKEEIDNEDKRHPLNDDKLVKVLAQRGYKIARRTVAKYREQLGIPVARLRHQV